MSDVSTAWHVSRTWEGHGVEDACPCPQEPCGFVAPDRAVPECRHHPEERVKAMRRGHPSDACPGVRDDAEGRRLDMRQTNAASPRVRVW